MFVCVVCVVLCVWGCCVYVLHVCCAACVLCALCVCCVCVWCVCVGVLCVLCACVCGVVCCVCVGTDIAMPIIELEQATRQAKARLYAVGQQQAVKASRAAIVKKRGSRHHANRKPAQQPSVPLWVQTQLEL